MTLLSEISGCYPSSAPYNFKNLVGPFLASINLIPKVGTQKISERIYLSKPIFISFTKRIDTKHWQKFPSFDKTSPPPSHTDRIHQIGSSGPNFEISTY